MFNKKSRKTLSKLFHQQCWCWGADIRNQDCNYLKAYGFAHFPKQKSGRGSSRYSLHRPAYSLHLWAFGAILVGSQTRTAISLMRYQNQPCSLSADTNPDHIVEACDLKKISIPIAPADLPLYGGEFNMLISEIISYENYINTNAPSGYRNKSVNGWKHKLVHGSNMAVSWTEIRDAA